MLTREEVKEVFGACLGIQPREADLQVIESLGATPDAVSDYLWDHFMGEPESPSQEQVHEAVKDLVNTHRRAKELAQHVGTTVWDATEDTRGEWLLYTNEIDGEEEVEREFWVEVNDNYDLELWESQEDEDEPELVATFAIFLRPVK